MTRFSGLAINAMLGVLVSASVDAGGTQPNIVMIMADDLSVEAYDAIVGSGLMPELETRLIQQGMSFSNAFVTDPICCPSRATFLTGQYTHNHHVFNNVNGISWGGWFPDGPDPGLESKSLPVWLQAAGYQTAYVGKYLNGYGRFAPVGVTPETYVPPGWNDWQVLLDPSTYRMFDYMMNDNGTVITYGELEADYQTDVLAARSVQFIQSQTGSGQPFFLNIAPLAPHTEVIDIVETVSGNDPLGVFEATVRPAPRHEILRDNDLFNGEVPSLVLKPSFNESDMSDKASCPRPDPPAGIFITTEPVCVGDKPALDPLIHQPLVEIQYKSMLASMVAVDELIGDVLDALDAIGVIDETVIIFTSDNGFFYGEHRLSGKSLSYDESSRVPLVIRGPGVAPASVAIQLVLNNDLAPTIADLAGASPLVVVDGSSVTAVLSDASAVWFRRNFLLENWFSPSYLKFTPATSHSLRILKGNTNILYINVHADTAQPALVTGYELYDLNRDPYAMESYVVPQSIIQGLAPFMSFLQSCRGQLCRLLEGI